MPKGMNESLYSYTLLLHTFWDAISSNGGGFALLLLFLLIDVKKKEVSFIVALLLFVVRYSLY